MMASPLPARSSRATTPESPLAKAATTIDDLTVALSNFSRAPTPDPNITCCCQREECESTHLWATLRAKLESRLVLSAEVGQALLERHEAYVRRQDAALSREASSIFSDADDSSSFLPHVEHLTKKLDTITEENSLMETRINELVIKNEMAEASNRTLMRELQEARAAIKRFSTQQARSVGWEMRLSEQTQEKEDMRQERDSQAHRARVAESKAAAFVEKCSKLQAEVHSLREDVQNYRATRADFSKSVLEEARARLEALQHSLGNGPPREDLETTRVLESLVADNETLKRDIAELQNLLLEAREDLRTMSEELEEYRAGMPSVDEVARVETPPPRALYPLRSPGFGRSRGHFASNSITSTSSHILNTPSSKHHRHNLSGATRVMLDVDYDDHLSPGRPYSPSHSPSGHSGDLDFDNQSTSSNHRTNVKSLMLLSRSRGVQTDPQPNIVSAYPSPRPSTLGVDRDSQEARSDTSSISQQDPKSMGAISLLIEKVAGLFLRMAQSDVRTLTNRLKRQHLLAPGSDARHLSHATISGIVNEIASIRATTYAGRDEVPMLSASLSMSRNDIKALLKLFKDIFAELGMLRGQMNEVIFDPSVAHKLRKEATAADPIPRPPSAMGGWIAPIQKLFTNHPTTQPSDQLGVAGATSADFVRGKTPMRVAPKLAPAISATSTTVNVEFASSGVRKTDAVSSSPVVTGPSVLRMPVAVPHSASRNLMGIFAGAPQSYTTSSQDRWVVLPKNDRDQLRQAKSSSRLGENGARTGGRGILGRSVTMSTQNRLSRNVDAVIDQNGDNGQVPDFRQTLLERTLRPRGLSDSSIHTTFVKGEDLNPPIAEKKSELKEDSLPDCGDPIGAPTDMSAPTSRTSSPSRGTTSPSKAMGQPEERARSPAARLGRNLASWASAAAASGRHYNQVDGDILFGSPREDGGIHYTAWARRGMEGREY